MSVASRWRYSEGSDVSLETTVSAIDCASSSKGGIALFRFIFFCGLSGDTDSGDSDSEDEVSLDFMFDKTTESSEGKWEKLTQNT